jgi:hypothetical protein
LVLIQFSANTKENFGTDIVASSLKSTVTDAYSNAAGNLVNKIKDAGASGLKVVDPVVQAVNTVVNAVTSVNWVGF